MRSAGCISPGLACHRTQLQSASRSVGLAKRLLWRKTSKERVTLLYVLCSRRQAEAGLHAATRSCWVLCCLGTSTSRLDDVRCQDGVFTTKHNILPAAMWCRYHRCPESKLSQAPDMTCPLGYGWRTDSHWTQQECGHAWCDSIAAHGVGQRVGHNHHKVFRQMRPLHGDSCWLGGAAGAAARQKDQAMTWHIATSSVLGWLCVDGRYHHDDWESALITKARDVPVDDASSEEEQTELCW